MKCDRATIGELGPDVIAEAFERQRPRIHALISRLLADPDEAHDLTQETFLRAYRGLPAINREPQLKHWLTRIATNICLDQLRRRRIIRWQAWDDGDAEVGRLLVATDDPEREMLRLETRIRVHRVLDALPRRYRTCLVLREHHGLDYEALGAMVGCTASGARSLLLRARLAFRRCYDAQEATPASLARVRQ